MMKSKFFFALIMSMTLGLISCNSNEVYNEHTDIINYVWKKADKKQFKVTIQDTQVPYSIALKIRHTIRLVYGNMRIKVMLASPSGKATQESFIVHFRDAKTQELISDAAGDMCDREEIIVPEIKFEEKGDYTFELEQDMDKEDIPEIMHVGVIVNKKQ